LSLPEIEPRIIQPAFSEFLYSYKNYTQILFNYNYMLLSNT